jgi:Na+/glutamate symporter
MLAHDLMERTLLGMTRSIAEGGGHGTAIRRKARALSAEGFPTANRIAVLDHRSFCVPA